MPDHHLQTAFDVDFRPALIKRLAEMLIASVDSAGNSSRTAANKSLEKWEFVSGRCMAAFEHETVSGADTKRVIKHR